MKRTITFLSILISTFAFSQEPYFSMKEGSVSEYVNKDADGKVLNYFSSKVTEVSGDMVNGSITFIYDFYNDKKEPLFGSNNEMEMIVKMENGKTFAKMSELKKATKSQDIMAKGDASSIPFELKVGDSIKDGLINVSVKAVKSTLSVTERKVTGSETITTPAGTFNCMVLSEKQTDKVFGITTISTMTSWIAKGVGIVRQKIYNKDGNLICDQELIKITQ